jgi:hypothetical protein
MQMQDAGKLFLLIGGVFLGLGLVLSFFGKIPWIGKLPGDISIKKEHFAFYFPFTTSVLISVILTVIALIFRNKS